MTTTSRSVTSRRAGLDRDDVVDAALALVEEEGPDALTMRRLAAALDVTTTTIYWHVGGRDELVGAVIERMSARLAARPVVGETALDRVVSAARNIFDSARAHRHVTSLAHQTGTSSRLQRPLEVALVRELEAAGVRGTAARDATRAIVACTAGFLVVALRSDRGTDLATTWRGPEVTGISSETLAALRRSPALPALYESTMRSVVAGLLPDPGGRP